MFGTALIPHIQTPTFFTVSAFDIWQIRRILCMPDNSHEIDRYGSALRQEVKAAVRASGVPHGLFVDSCPHHTYCMDTIKVTVPLCQSIPGCNVLTDYLSSVRFTAGCMVSPST